MSKEQYYLQLAADAAKRSTCLKRNYGAILVKDDRIISTGYNGAPRGRKNCTDIGSCPRLQVPSNTDYSLCRSVHAEANAIIHANYSDMIDSVLYLAGWDCLTGKEVEVTEPCPMCKRMIINAQINRVIVPDGKDGYTVFPVKKWTLPNMDDSIPKTSETKDELPKSIKNVDDVFKGTCDEYHKYLEDNFKAIKQQTDLAIKEDMEHPKNINSDRWLHYFCLYRDNISYFAYQFCLRKFMVPHIIEYIYNTANALAPTISTSYEKLIYDNNKDLYMNKRGDVYMNPWGIIEFKFSDPERTVKIDIRGAINQLEPAVKIYGLCMNYGFGNPIDESLRNELIRVNNFNPYKGLDKPPKDWKKPF
jgi:dCMP deaminase